MIINFFYTQIMHTNSQRKFLFFCVTAFRLKSYFLHFNEIAGKQTHGIGKEKSNPAYFKFHTLIKKTSFIFDSL